MDLNPIHISVKRLNGVVLAFVGVALLIVAIDLNFSLNAPHPANAQVVGVQFGGLLIPTETAILLHDDRILRVMIVRNEIPPAFVEWAER